MTAIDAFDDPDGLDRVTMALVAEAAGLLRSIAVPRDEAVEATVQRVRAEAIVSVLAGSIFGSIGRVARATPDLLGLREDPPGSHDGPTSAPTEDPR